MEEVRLIDANALHKRIEMNLHASNPFTIEECCYKDALNSVDEAPTIEPESLRGHAKWVKDKELKFIMGVDTTGKDKAEVVAAVAEEPVEVPDISKMKLEELKEFAEDNGIDLTGCTTKASILQKIREYEADAAAAAAIISPEG